MAEGVPGRGPRDPAIPLEPAAAVAEGSVDGARLAEAEARYRALAAGIRDALLIVCDSRVRFWNAPFIALTGLEPTVGSELPPAFLAAERIDGGARLAEALTASTAVFDGTYRVAGAGGAARAFEISATAVAWGQRRATQLLLHAPDAAPSSGGALEERVQVALEAIRAELYDWDVGSGLVRRTDGLRALLGYGPSEVPPTIEWWNEQVHPEDRAAGHAEAQAAVAARRPLFENEYRIRHRAGHYLWVRGACRLHYDAAGQLVRVVGCAFDIDARRRAEDRHRADAELLRVTLANPTIVLATNDRDLRYTAIRNLVQDFDPGRVLGRRDTEIIDNPGTRALEALKAEVLASGQERRAAIEFPLAQGARSWELIASPIRGAPAGVPEGVATLALDVTERVRMERELAGQRALIELALDIDTVGVVFFGYDGRVRRVNATFARMSGLAREELEGPGFDGLAITAPESLAGSLAALEEYRQCGRVAPYEKQYVRPDGSRWWALVTAARVSEHEGVEFTLDISSQKRAEAALREADRRKDAFLATLSHELRNPLAPIRTAVELLAAPSLAPGRLAWIRRMIERQVQQMAALLDDLLDVARITQAKIELRIEPVNLAQVIESAAEMARSLISAKGHRLQVHLPLEPLEIRADRVRLVQVLANLLTNAAKYTDPGGHIEVFAALQNEEFEIRVRDNGIGLAPEARERIFEMFSQIDGALDRAEGGLGIGLALVRGLVQLHGGRVEAHSEGVGRGSEFRVYLPRRAPSGGSAEPLPGSADFERPARAARLRVLVADDNRDAAESLAMLLELEGHEVHLASEGREALALVHALRPDVVLLDIGMPKLDGYEVARAVRASPECQHIGLIALSGWGQRSDIEAARSAGFDRHLVKPVDPHVLAATLTQVAGAHHACPTGERASGG